MVLPVYTPEIPRPPSDGHALVEQAAIGFLPELETFACIWFDILEYGHLATDPTALPTFTTTPTSAETTPTPTQFSTPEPTSTAQPKEKQSAVKHASRHGIIRIWFPIIGANKPEPVQGPTLDQQTVVVNTERTDAALKNISPWAQRLFALACWMWIVGRVRESRAGRKKTPSKQ